MKEIGSEFWECEVTQNMQASQTQYFAEWTFYMTGRTALYAILQDIKLPKTGQKLKALLPAYCCHSMIMPFIESGFSTEFYDIGIMNLLEASYEIENIENFDVILLMNYFGLGVRRFEEILAKLNQNRKQCKVIVDITHSWLSPRTSFNNADYCFGSLRKWTGLFSGGIAKKSQGKLAQSSEFCDDKFLNNRIGGMKLKGNYIDNAIGEKNVFLKVFANAEDSIDESYIGFCMDEQSRINFSHLDKALIAAKRQSNYTELLKNKETLLSKEIYPLCTQLDDDVPLCFPVYIEGEQRRDKIRKHLISNDIYCPVHWPAHGEVKSQKNAMKMSEHELSIVCDQRYDAEDMEKIIRVIKEYKD